MKKKQKKKIKSFFFVDNNRKSFHFPAQIVAVFDLKLDGTEILTILQWNQQSFCYFQGPFYGFVTF